MMSISDNNLVNYGNPASLPEKASANPQKSVKLMIEDSFHSIGGWLAKNQREVTIALTIICVAAAIFSLAYYAAPAIALNIAKKLAASGIAAGSLTSLQSAHMVLLPAYILLPLCAGAALFGDRGF
ncbi:MAG: hypothetical protein H0W88_05905 [Parachlamydiaceae bacterium]|nr:hypothetical protein [Parachlamydiaceae bacterium]